MPAGRSQTIAKPRGKPLSSPKGQRPADGGGPAASPRLILLAAAGVLALAVTATLATGGRGERLTQAIGRGADNQFAGAGFRLRAVHVEGASPMATPDIVRAAGVYRDQPMLGMDLEALRQRVRQVGWVEEARVVRLLPDTLVLAVVERKQVAVWQHAGRSLVIDDKGQVIPEADAARFATLPLVVGQGGARHAPELLPLLARRRQLMERTDALVRVDDRRWDIRLKDGSLIQLPAAGEDAALTALEQLDLRSHVFALGFERIDLRNPDVVAIRPREPAPAAPPATAGA